MHLLNKIFHDYYLNDEGLMKNEERQRGKINYILENQSRVLEEPLQYGKRELEKKTYSQLCSICNDLRGEIREAKKAGRILTEDTAMAPKEVVPGAARLNQIKKANALNAGQDKAKGNTTSSNKTQAGQTPNKFTTSTEQEEEIMLNRGKGLEDVRFDVEPGEQYKEKMKKDMGEKKYSEREAKAKYNANQPRYKKDPQPVVVVKKEDVVASAKPAINEGAKSALTEETDRMKQLFGYKTSTYVDPKKNISSREPEVMNRMLKENKATALNQVINGHKILSKVPIGREKNSYDNKTLNEWRFKEFSDYVEDYSSLDNKLAFNAPQVLKAVLPENTTLSQKVVKEAYDKLRDLLLK